MTTPLTPERRAELRARFYTPPSATAWMSIREDELDALLDAADERDRLARECDRLEAERDAPSLEVTSLRAERDRLAARLAEVERELAEADQSICAQIVQRKCALEGPLPRWTAPPVTLDAWRALLAEADAAGEWVVGQPRDFTREAFRLEYAYGCDECGQGIHWNLNCMDGELIAFVLRIPAPPPEDRP